MHPSELLAGTQLSAGLTAATVLPDLDFETRSEAGYFFDPESCKWHGPHGSPGGASGIGLSCVGMATYAMHHSTRLLSMAYDLKDGRGRRRWLPGMSPPADLIAHVSNGGLIEAWNSGFEWWIWNAVCVRLYGWPPLSYLQVRCAMAKAAAHCLPRALANAGNVLQLTVRKDKRGTDLLKKFSMPRNPTKGDPRLWHTPEEFPLDAEALYQYNETDIVTEAEASSLIPDLAGEELDFWLVDQLINRRGVAVDTGPLSDCVAIVDQCLDQYTRELCALTGGVVERPSQIERLKGWLAGQGVHMGEGKGTGDEEAFEAVLAATRARAKGMGNPALTDAIRAIELRLLVGSSSVKKVFAMTNSLAPDGRLHDLFNYHGARTGRPTGEGAQPTNLPKTGPKVMKCASCGRCFGAVLYVCPWCTTPRGPTQKSCEWSEAVDDALAVIRLRDVRVVQAYFGDAMHTVAGCLRGLFVAADGCDLVSSDFSSIEGVVTAALAGEDWRMDMFATHGKAYELSVSKITGIPFATIMASAGFDDVESPEWWTRRARKGEHHPMRQTIGKVAELASGFGGWINAWKRFGAEEFMADHEIKEAILAWRDASPAIVHFWGGQEVGPWGRKEACLFGLEGMAIAAVLSPGTPQPVMRMDGTHSGVAYLMHGDVLYCLLPSGRPIAYHRPRLSGNPRGWGGQYSLTFEGHNSDASKGPVGWHTISTYGGKLCENVVQATARDIQRYAILNLERAGYHVVLHVYDEDVAEVPQGFGSVEGLEAIMSTMPAWATYKGKPWPIKANGGWRGRRYRKA
jgi:DNA polymerase